MRRRNLGGWCAPAGQLCLFSGNGAPTGVRQVVPHAPVPPAMPGPCWSGKACPSSYGARDDPTGFIDVFSTSHWRCTQAAATGPPPAQGSKVMGALKNLFHQ